MLFAAAAILAGFLVGLFLPFEIPLNMATYIAIGIMACLDTLFGGLNAYYSGKFKSALFVTGFFGNAMIAALLILLGEKLLGVSLQIPVLVVYSIRMFTNFASLRRYFLAWLKFLWKV